MNKKTNIQRIFTNLFLVQLLLNTTSCFCSIANGYFAGNFLDSLAISCNSLIIPFNYAISAVSNVFSSASEIMCGKFLGKGDKKSLNKTFTIVITIAVVLSIIFTIVVYLFPTTIIKLLGGNNEIMNAATLFLYANSIGIFAYILMPIFITFLNIENEGKYVTKSVVLLVVLYIFFGITFTRIIKLSYFGLGLANSLSQILTLLFLFARLVKNKNQIYFTKTNIDFAYIKKIFLLGIPSGYTAILFSIRNIIFNNIILSKGGVLAMSAYSVAMSSTTLEGVVVTSCLNTATIATSICVGEKNIEELHQLIKHIFTYVVSLNLIFTVLQIVFSKYIVSIYTTDIEIINIAIYAFIILTISTIFEIINDSLIAMYTVLEDYKFVSVYNVLHCFALHVFFALLLSKYFGYYAVFLSYLFTEIFSFIVYGVYSILKNKRFVKTYYDLLVVNKSFNYDKKFYISIKDSSDVTNISEKITKFCLENDIDKRRANLAGLCIEELVTNIYDHGFTKTRINSKKVDTFVIIDNNDISLRIRDNAVAFNPETRSIIFNPEEPTKNIGLRIVKNICKEMTYQNLFGLNNTIIKL